MSCLPTSGQFGRRFATLCRLRVFVQGPDGARRRPSPYEQYSKATTAGQRTFVFVEGWIHQIRCPVRRDDCLTCPRVPLDDQWLIVRPGWGEAGPSLANVTTRSVTGRHNSNILGVSEHVVMMILSLARNCSPPPLVICAPRAARICAAWAVRDILRLGRTGHQARWCRRACPLSRGCGRPAGASTRARRGSPC
jgi:hypothetical protein